MKVGDRVNWRGRPSHTGTVTEVNPNWYELLIGWDDGGFSWFSPGELEYLPEPWEKTAPPSRAVCRCTQAVLNVNRRVPTHDPGCAAIPAVCRCPIKDLTSVGHTDPNCPERRR